jgi:hypothetical protein
VSGSEPVERQPNGLEDRESARIFSDIGLSLRALAPAAAWYVIFLAGDFLPLRGKKHLQRIENLGERKSYDNRIFILNHLKDRL